MFKFLNKKKNNKGFSLVELVIVIAILAILVGILAPQYTKYVEKSRKAADATNLEELVTAFKTAASDGEDQIKAGTYTITIGTSANVVATGDGATANNTVTSLIGSYAGDKWTSTSLKSSKWTDNSNGTGDTLTSISAVMVVKNDGSVSVSYNPEWLKEMSKQKVN